MIQGGDPTGTGRYSESIWGFSCVSVVTVDIPLKMRSRGNSGLRVREFSLWYIPFPVLLL